MINISRKKEKEEKAKIHRQRIYIISPDEKKANDTQDFLRIKGFKNTIAFILEPSEKINVGDVVILDHLDTEVILDIQKKCPGAKFFFYKNERWEDKRVTMTNFANSKDSLTARLFETLKTIA